MESVNLSCLGSWSPDAIGFVNYMINYVDRQFGCDLCELILRGYGEWNDLSQNEQLEYHTSVTNGEFFDACCPRRKRKRQTCRRKPRCPRRRRKPACRPKPRCPRRKRRKPRCCPTNPVTNNAFLNFLRMYRRKHRNPDPRELLKEAARAWCRLSERKKNIYRRQACKVSKSCRHKHRRVCG